MCGEHGRASGLDLHGRPTWGEVKERESWRFLGRSGQGNRRKAGVLGATKAEGTGSLKGVGAGRGKKECCKAAFAQVTAAANHRLGSSIGRHLFEVWEAESRVPAWSGSAEALFLLTDSCCFFGPSHGGEGDHLACFF